MHASRSFAWAGVVGVVALGGTAFADDATGSADTTTGSASLDTSTMAPGEGLPAGATEQFTLPRGTLFLDAFLEINLSSDAAFKPVSLAPDLWYGVTDDLTLGIVHSSNGATGIIGGVGDALCLTGKDNGCASFYPGLGIDARYRLKGAFAFDGGLYVRDFDPFALAIKVGVVGRLRVSKLAIDVQPNLFLGLTERDSGNKELLTIPVTASYPVAPRLALYLQPALSTPFSDGRELWRLSLALGARFRVNDHLDLGLAFALPLLAGGPDGTGADFRTLTLGAGYAF